MEEKNVVKKYKFIFEAEIEELSNGYSSGKANARFNDIAGQGYTVAGMTTLVATLAGYVEQVLRKDLKSTGFSKDEVEDEVNKYKVECLAYIKRLFYEDLKERESAIFNPQDDEEI